MSYYPGPIPIALEGAFVKILQVPGIKSKDHGTQGKLQRAPTGERHYAVLDYEMGMVWALDWGDFELLDPTDDQLRVWTAWRMGVDVP